MGDALLRIHFTPEDLGRIRFEATVDPLWEMVFSRVRLTERDRLPMLASWARQLRHHKRIADLRCGLRLLNVLAPLGPYFPDFLTPQEGAQGLRQAIEAIRRTPCARLRHELTLLSRTSTLPDWAGRLAEGDKELLGDLGDTLSAYHQVAIEPHTDMVLAAVEADRAHRARTLLTAGVDGMLTTLPGSIRWAPPVLEVHYVVDQDMHLRGRGLRLVPSFFCRRAPVALADPDLPPTLVYPVTAEGWDYPPPAGGGPTRDLAALFGATRAAVLAATRAGATTTELAERLHVNASSISRHTTALRGAGLITTRRRGGSVLHTVSPLGAALLDGR